MNTQGIIGHIEQLRKLGIMIKASRLPQAMIFFGMRGTGKTLVAKKVLTSLFCKAQDPPCGRCPDCIRAGKGTLPDLIEIAPDDKGRIPIGDPDTPGAGTVRWLIKRLNMRSTTGIYGILISDADFISTEGQNALLKLIEEPPDNTHIILTASHRFSLLPTIISRCTEIVFNPLSESEIQEIIKKSGKTGNYNILSALSGGSASIAMMLMDDSIRKSILDIAADISNSAGKGLFTGMDTTEILKSMSAEDLLITLSGLYRHLYITSLKGTSPEPELKHLMPGERETCEKIIKILLALKQGIDHNLNLKYAFRGLFCAIEQVPEQGICSIDHILGESLLNGNIIS